MPRRSKNDAANAAETAIESHVAGRIRLRRGLRGMSQSDLARALGITFQQVQKYERGSNRVSVGKLYRLADILDVPLVFFFDGLEGAGMPRLPADEVPEPAGILSRRELDLLRAWRQAPPEVADIIAGLLRSITPDLALETPAPADHQPAALAVGPEASSPETVQATAEVLPASVEAEGRAARPKPVQEAPRRRGRPPGPAKAKLVQAGQHPKPPSEEGRQRRQRGAVWDPADIRDYGEEA
ncbi:helix-turn-helix domain-containing protein [Asticcacaulis sp.]|uniref:helix-turn-helix domain-containing protein n=1 Tax=Asticcacaulis sp. TaxID=1872648 RepID=UPI00345AA563